MAGEAKPLTDFLVDLSEDEGLRREFRRDPDRAMQNRGLTGRQQAAVKSRNVRQIEEEVQAENPGVTIMSFVGIQVE